MVIGMKTGLNDFGTENTKSIINMLNSKSVIKKCEAICEIVKLDIHDPNIANALKMMKSDDSSFWNFYTVHDFAVAALHLLGIEKYNGHREEIQNLISVHMNFSSESNKKHRVNEYRFQSNHFAYRNV